MFKKFRYRLKLKAALRELNLVNRLGALARIRPWRRSASVRESRFQRALGGGLSDLRSTAFRDK